jgi:predicted deacylase
MNVRLLAGVILLASFAAGADAVSDTPTPRCSNAQFRIDTHFESGKLDKCKLRRDGTFEITLRPEDRKVIVEQPWFAFRISASAPGELRIRLRIPDGYARYWPKLSSDGTDWQRAPDNAVTIAASGKSMDIALPLQEGPLWIAAQELLPISWYEKWLAKLEKRDDLTVAVIGQSAEGRSIQLLKTANRPETVILLGRQHPAEIPGAMAMRDFVEVVLADTELARQFRQRFTLVIIPLLNPDGVANGHWRHNAGRTDLNRDWNQFSQPETRAVLRLLAGMDALQMRPRLMLDFHATRQTRSLLFYTQTADEVTDPPQFDQHWFDAVRERLPDFEFDHSPGPSDKNPNTKGYFYRRYGIPAFTYELADEVDRAELHATTPILAEEMMRTLLRTE